MERFTHAVARPVAHWARRMSVDVPSIFVSRSRSFSDLPAAVPTRLRDGREIVIRALQPGDATKLFTFLHNTYSQDPEGYAKRFPLKIVGCELGAIVKDSSPRTVAGVLSSGVTNAVVMLDSKGEIHGLLDYDESLSSKLLSWLGRPRAAEANVIVDKEFQEAEATSKLVRASLEEMRRKGYKFVHADREGSWRRIDLSRPGVSQAPKVSMSPMPGGDD